MAKHNLRFLLYTVHAHVETGTVDYLGLVKTLVLLKGYHFQEGKRNVAFGEAKIINNRLFLVVYTGDTEKSILFFDLAEQAEISTPNTPRRFQARKTHVIVDPQQRLTLIETGRGRIAAEDLAKILEDRARAVESFRTLEMSLSPIAAKEFVNAIDTMDRIQAATVSIARPNVTWTDNFNALTKLADESEGKAIDATVRAKRGASLSKDNGLIPNIKAWVSEKMSSVYSASIKGEKPDSVGLTVLKLSDYVESVTVPVETKPDTGLPVEAALEEGLNKYLDSRKSGNA